MDVPDFFTNDPFRRPVWRAERATQLAYHRPHPLLPKRYDDNFVRVYYRFLKCHRAAGGDAEKRRRLCPDLPHVEHAHRLHFSADQRSRQIVEAWLLTDAPFQQIAAHFATDALTIEYYEKLFFHVRDRRHNRDWIRQVIKGPAAARAPNPDGSLWEGQRGFILRWVAYHGGPQALSDLVASGFARQSSQKPEDVAQWFQEALSGVTRVRVLEVALTLLATDSAHPDLVKWALRDAKLRKSTRGNKKADKLEENDHAIIEAIRRQWPALSSELLGETDGNHANESKRSEKGE